MRMRAPRSRLRIWFRAGAWLTVWLWLALGAVRVPAQSADCGGCHAKIAESFSQTGMARSFHRLTPNDGATADFSNRNRFYHAASERHYEVFELDGRFFLRRWQTSAEGREVNLVEKEIHYALGSGNHAVGWLHRTPDNRLVQLPVSWYAADGGYWAMAPGYDRPDHADFRREIDLECMFCHNAYPPEDAAEVPGAAVRFGEALPEGIDCRRCHGSGDQHVAAIRRGETEERVRAAVLNPARLEPERQLEVCMQCHLETTTSPLPHSIRRAGRGYFSYSPAEPLADYALHFDHPPGAGRDDKFEVVNAVYRLRQSRCFAESSAMTCTTCHDPHHIERGEAATARYNQVCRDCHQDSPKTEGVHAAGADCVACHMPKRVAEDALHVRMTDHRIERRPKEARPAEELDETGGAAYRGEVALYYPESLPDDDELYLALAQVQDGSNLELGLPRLERAILRLKPEEPKFDYFLGEGYRRVGRLEKAAKAYQAALRKDAEYWPATLGLGLAQAAAGELETAAKTLETAAALAPDQTSVAVALGETYYRLERFTEARETLLGALEKNLDSPEAHNTLGAVYIAQRRPAAAEAELREAIRHRPDYGVAHANLAATLLATGRPAEALESYNRALDLGEDTGAVRQGRAQALAALRQ